MFFGLGVAVYSYAFMGSQSSGRGNVEGQGPNNMMGQKDINGLRDGSGDGIGSPYSNRPFIRGDVTAIDGTKITISVKLFDKDQKTEVKTDTYEVDASEATFYVDGLESTISEIAVSDTIMVEGEMIDKTIKATKIHEGNMAVGNRANFEDRNNFQERERNNRSFWNRMGNFFSGMFGKKNK